MRYTEYHGGIPVIKDKSLLPGAMKKLAVYEDIGEVGCAGCSYERHAKTLYPCKCCMRGKGDKYKSDK